jgi:hypothetical protein
MLEPCPGCGGTMVAHCCDGLTACNDVEARGADVRQVSTAAPRSTERSEGRGAARELRRRGGQSIGCATTAMVRLRVCAREAAVAWLKDLAGCPSRPVAMLWSRSFRHSGSNPASEKRLLSADGQGGRQSCSCGNVQPQPSIRLSQCVNSLLQPALRCFGIFKGPKQCQKLGGRRLRKMICIDDAKFATDSVLRMTADCGR